MFNGSDLVKVASHSIWSTKDTDGWPPDLNLSCFQRVCEIKTTFTINLKDTLFRVYSELSTELVLYLFLNVGVFGNSLVAQWLRHHAFTARGANPFLVEELKSHVTTKLMCCSCWAHVPQQEKPVCYSKDPLKPKLNQKKKKPKPLNLCFNFYYDKFR